MRRPRLPLILTAVVLAVAFCAILIANFGFTGPASTSVERFVGAAERAGAVNMVSAIYLNVRLFDTLLEVLVFAVAVLGVRFYLTARGRPEAVEKIPESRVVGVAADVLLPLILLVSVYVTIHGHLSPGGGFSGGVIAGSGLLLAAMVAGTDAVDRRLGGRFLGRVEWAALLGVFVLASVPVALGRTPLSDLLPAGTPGAIGSGGSILLYNMLIGLKVFIGSWVIVKHFVDHRGEI